MACGKHQRGFLLAVAIVLLVVGSMLAAAMAYMVGTSGSSASDNLQSGQALFLAESGLEFETRRMAQNLDWYRSTADPFDQTTQGFGQGSFTVQTNLPATMLRAHANSGDTTITVYTTNRFPNFNATPSPPTTCSPCYLQLDDDINGGAEYVRYTGISGNTFTGLTRNLSIGTTPAHTGTSGARNRGSAVYPVTTLSVALPANCTAPANVQIVAHSKFLGAGTLDIEGEEISYKNSSNSGGVMTLTGITRCLDDVTGPPGNTPASHAVSAPVTPVLIGDFSKDYEAQVVPTGTVGNTQRVMNRTLQR
jgi:Tfp pilus assembly protein PilX